MDGRHLYTVMTITVLVSDLFPTFKSHSATLSTFKSRSSGMAYEFGEISECGFFGQLAHKRFLVKEAGFLEVHGPKNTLFGQLTK